MGDRIRWAFHKGKPVLRVDYSGLKGAEMLSVIQQVPEFYKGQPKGSVLCLADVRDSFADAAAMGAMKALGKETKPYDKKVAVLGITGAKGVLLSAVNLFSTYDQAVFDRAGSDRLADLLSERPGAVVRCARIRAAGGRDARIVDSQGLP